MNINEKINKKDITIKVFQGKWCSMCLTALPKIAEFISENSIDTDRVEIIEVNSTKSKPADLLGKYDIFRIPTVVFEAGGKEVKRITEFAPKGWKQEMKDNIMSV